MKKSFLIPIVVLVLLFSLVGAVTAITNGQPDNERHPYVGLLVFDSEECGGGPCWRCSGSLISPTIVLTAGHCTDGATAARVWFDEDVTSAHIPYPFYPYGGPGSGAIEGIPYTNPDYNSPENPYGGGNGLPAFSYRDVGVVVLNEPVYMNTYATLPAPGLVDTLKNKTKLDLVGYGVQEQLHGGGPPVWTGLRIRLYAPSELVSGNFVHSAEYMRIALNPGGGSGGTCFGDSGGPNLLRNSTTVLAVNSYVTNSNCSGVGYSARVDIPEVLEWIESFME